MINLSKLLRDDTAFPGDELRYGGQFGCPVVVWHVTGDCNLRCAHCYAAGCASEPMPADEAARFLERLSFLRPPALLLSGGEPLAHPRIFDYIARAGALGLRLSLSTNGTLIGRAEAEQIAASAVSYVGVSLDGKGSAHDEFRGAEGSFAAAVAGIRNLRSAGCRVGLRVTLARPVLPSLPGLFALAAELGVSRVCFYHFVPSGRGADDAALMPSPEEERQAVREIIKWAESETASIANPIEILTVGDASDGLYLYDYLRKNKPRAATRALSLIEQASRREIGAGIASVRWDGILFAHQFDWNNPLGTWRDLPLKRAARRGRECADCRVNKYCSGSLRAEKSYPCLLSEEERRGSVLI